MLKDNMYSKYMFDSYCMSPFKLCYLHSKDGGIALVLTIFLSFQKNKNNYILLHLDPLVLCLLLAMLLSPSCGMAAYTALTSALVYAVKAWVRVEPKPYP